MAYVSFVPDNVLEAEVMHLIAVARQAKMRSKEKFGKNVIDPFAAIFEIAGFGIDHSAWFESEMTRQAQKTLQNHIGTFHQNVLGAVFGWHNLGTGSVVDLVNSEQKIIAEVKNKYNTISGGKLAELYGTLERLVMPKASDYKDYTAYYVSVIPKKPERYERPFTPSDKEKGARCPSNALIREIDGNSFYELVTGTPDALQSLYDVLPDVIETVVGDVLQVHDIDMLKRYFVAAFGRP
ncbi:MAG: Eco47II family restriction endonuclease [Ardenticatenaceae bacterium]|nr:Eco47II family restriction endonuclease [Ardenticatenaceae bacterium]